MLNKKEYTYHHIGLPTTVSRKNEEYNEVWKFYASGYFDSQFGIEWLRIDKDSPLHPLIKALPHIAFVVKDIKKCILGQEVIYGPNNPAEGVTVCFVKINGAPIEFLQFDKPESDIWPNDNKLVNPMNSLRQGKGLASFKYHHFGISGHIKKEDSHSLKGNILSYSNPQENPFGIYWLNCIDNCSLPSTLQQISHVAFQVDNLMEAIKGRKVIVDPFSPSKGVLVAFIEENGAPIEFLQIAQL